MKFNDSFSIEQLQPEKRPKTKEVNFSISPETLQKTAKERISIPRFLITGLLDSTDCCVTKPFTGNVNAFLFPCNRYQIQTKFFFQLTVQHTEVAIKSVELQLVRVETCGCAEGYSRDGKPIV